MPALSCACMRMNIPASMVMFYAYLLFIPVVHVMRSSTITKTLLLSGSQEVNHTSRQ